MVQFLHTAKLERERPTQCKDNKRRIVTLKKWESLSKLFDRCFIKSNALNKMATVDIIRSSAHLCRFIIKKCMIF